MTRIDVRHAGDRLSTLIERARRGEDVVLTDDDRPLARLVAADGSGRRRPGSAKGLIQMSDDFDEPLDELDEYT